MPRKPAGGAPAASKAKAKAGPAKSKKVSCGPEDNAAAAPDPEGAADEDEAADGAEAAEGDEAQAAALASETLSSLVSVALEAKFDKETSSVHFALSLFKHDTRRIEVCSLTDHGNMPLLEAVLLQIAPNQDFALNVCDGAMPVNVRQKIFNVVKNCLESEEVMIHETTKGFNSKEAVSKLRERLLDPDCLKAAEHALLDLEPEMRAVGCLISCATHQGLGLLTSPVFFESCSLHAYTGHKSFLKLDKAAFAALHILPQDKKDVRSSTSLLGFLNKCRTPLGTRRLQKWLRQPLTDETEILKRHDVVEVFFRDQALLQKVQRSLKQVIDLDKLIQRLQRTAVSPDAPNGATLEDLYQIWRCLQSAIQLVEELYEDCESDDNPLRVHLIAPLERVLQQFSNFCRMVENTVDMESAHDIRKKPVVNPQFDEQFMRIRSEQNAILKKMDDYASRIDKILENKIAGRGGAGKPPMKSAKGAAAAADGDDGTSIVRRVEHTVREEREWALRVVKKNHQAMMQLADAHGFIPLSLKKSESVFTTKELQKWNEELATKDVAYELAQSELVKKCCKVAATYVPVLEKLSDLLATLDVLQAFAHVVSTATAKFVRPKLVLQEDDEGEGTAAGVEGTAGAVEMNGNSSSNGHSRGSGDVDIDMADRDATTHGSSKQQKKRLFLKQCTHPLVQENDSHSSSRFVPNDCFMDQDSGRFVTITGPNMGGKSTFIRQVALCVLLCQIGMFVPAEEAEMSVFTSIMARVGASDAQLKGISTFMAEMLESSTILQASDERALVIVDELGRGTSTQDGYGLAYAIAKYLCSEKQCFTLFATHFHELGELQAELGSAVQNKHAVALVDDNDTKLTFLYEMRDGVADRSYGVHVARLAKFPPTAVLSAKRTADFLERRARKKLKLEESGKSFTAVDQKDAADDENAEDKSIAKLLALFNTDSASGFASALLQDAISKEDFVQKVMTLATAGGGATATN
ncbi:unnamed protein product [Amoebophrya sp. A25]|nr:unnamed protein product [Amoebophrya sp. A25]|eukprot:GSA25T00016421001.1